MTRGITSLTTGLFTTVLFLVFALGGESFPSENTSQEILDKIDKMWRGESSTGTYQMKIKTSNWERTLRIKSWTKGLDHTLIKIEYHKKNSCLILVLCWRYRNFFGSMIF